MDPHLVSVITETDTRAHLEDAARSTHACRDSIRIGTELEAEAIDGAARSMRRDRLLVEYSLAALLGLTAATLILWQLESSASTSCFRRSLQIRIAEGEGTLRGCDRDAFDAVRDYVEEQRTKLATDKSFVPEEPDVVEGESALMVWMVLLAVTAGLAGISAVRSLFMIADLKDEWELSWASVSICLLVSVVLVLLPFLYFRIVRFGLTSFDDLHGEQLAWMPPFVGLLTLPAATALVSIGNILSGNVNLGLVDVARLGARMRYLITMLGAVLSLGVIATGSRWQAIGTLPGGVSLPNTVVLLWGGTFAAVLAALYVPVHQRWAKVTGALIATEVKRQVGHAGAGSVGFRPPELATKKELQAALGVGGALKTLQGSLAVLAPVVAAAISSLFS